MCLLCYCSTCILVHFTSADARLSCAAHATVSYMRCVHNHEGAALVKSPVLLVEDPMDLVAEVYVERQLRSGPELLAAMIIGSPSCCMAACMRVVMIMHSVSMSYESLSSLNTGCVS